MFSWESPASPAERCRTSIARSRSRRQVAHSQRRRRIRLRGGGVSAALVALTVAVSGAGVAVGHSSGALGGQSAGAGMLMKGSQGPAVAAVQRALGVQATGLFGPSTDRAVRAFQRRRGLLVDGIVGPQTRAALGLAAAPTGSRGTAAPAVGVPAALQRIARCESGGNPRAIGGGGRYRGKYQFTYGTWRALGGQGDPAAAPEAEQDRRAAMLYRRSGTASWPSCG